MSKLLAISFFNVLRMVLIGALCPFTASGKSLDNLSAEKILPSQSRLLYLKNQEALFKKLSETGAARGRGGDIGGGGTTIFWQGQRKLVDVFDLKTESNQKNLDRSEIKFDRFVKVDFRQTRLNSAIQDRIQRLRSLTPKLAEALRQVYNAVPFYFARGQFTFVSPSFELNPSVHYPEDAQFSTVAYNIQNFGILVSGDQFFEMDFESQVALVIHEMIRSLQIQFMLNTTHGEIQELTAAVVLGSGQHSVLLTSSLVQFLETLSFGPLADTNIHPANRDVSPLVASSTIETTSFSRLDFRKSKTWLDLAGALRKNSDEMKASEFYALSIQALNSRAQIKNFADIKEQGGFISNCSEENSNQLECDEFYKILSELIR